MALVAPAGASALSLEPVGTFDTPTYVTSDPSNPDRLFVVERSGRIQLVEDGNATTFLDIESTVLSPPDPGGLGDHGLYSLAFSPHYATDHLFYVAYSGVDDPDTVAEDEAGDWHLTEFSADGDSADPSRAREVLTIKYPAAQLHYAGQLNFGPDGYLYVTTGDGGPQGDPDGNAQNLESLLGKILRIDPSGSGPGEYTVPADNPFTDTASCTDGCDEIWAYGLRNPWRFSFDRLTGDLVIGDVGYSLWEEVDFAPGPDPGRGLNFGWNCREGAHPGPGESSLLCADRAGTFTEPVFEYAHVGPCSVTGGYVVRDRALDDLYGRYVYGDWCVGELRSLNLGLPTASGDRSEGLSVPRVTSFGEDAACRIYAVSIRGPVYRLTEPAADEQSGCSQPPEPPPPKGGSPPPDTSITLSLAAKRTQKVKKLEVKLSCGAEVCVAELGGKAVAKKKGGKRKGASAAKKKGKRTFKVKQKTFSIPAGEQKTKRVRFKKNKKSVLRRLLKRNSYRKGTETKLKVTATDAAGNTDSERAKVKLRR